MAERSVGVGKRVAAQRAAWICFEDEAGQTLRPPKAKTWGRRGQTPQIPVSGKGSGRISIAGLVCLKPGQQSRLIYRTRIHRGRKGQRRSFAEADYAALLDAAHQQLGAPIVLVWDKCAVWRLAAFPVQPGRTRREVLGSPDLPGGES